MTKLSDKFEPIDIIAIVIILACIGARLAVNDPMFNDIMKIVIGFYFGNKVKSGGIIKTPYIIFLPILFLNI